MEYSSTPLSTLTLPRRSFISETLQIEHDQPVSADNISSNIGQTNPKDVIYGKFTERIFYVMSLNIEGQPIFESNLLFKLYYLQLNNSIYQQNTPYYNSMNDNDNNNKAESLRVKSKMQHNGLMIRYRIRYPLSLFNVESNNKNEIEAIQ